MTDFLRRGLAGDYRVAIASTTATIAEASRRHGLTGIPAVALSRALTSLALVGITDKEGRRLSAQWMGRGPLGSVHADLQQTGALRGYLTGDQPAASIPDGFGRGGLLSVIRQQPNGSFMQGQVALRSRTVDGDLEGYLKQSDQVASALRVLVDLDAQGSPTAVTGMLIQALPDSDGRSVPGLMAPALADRSLSAALPVDQLLAQGAPALGPVDWMLEVPLAWRCGCSKERVEQGVRLLGLAELDDMVLQWEGTEVRCDFCAHVHVISPADIARLRDELAAD